MEHQAADAVSRLKTIESDQTLIEAKLPVFCIMASIFPEKGEARLTYIQGYDVSNDKKEIRIPEVYLAATSTDTEQHKRPKTAQEFVHKEAKESYFCQASSTVGLSCSKFDNGRNRFLVHTVPIDGLAQKSLQFHYNCSLYITCIISHWQASCKR